MGILVLTLQNGKLILTLKGQRSQSCERKCKKVFVHIFVTSGSIYTNQYRNDIQLILHIVKHIFHQRKCVIFRFVFFWKYKIVFIYITKTERHLFIYFYNSNSLSPKYIYCTPLSSHSAKHQRRYEVSMVCRLRPK